MVCVLIWFNSKSKTRQQLLATCFNPSWPKTSHSLCEQTTLSKMKSQFKLQECSCACVSTQIQKNIKSGHIAATLLFKSSGSLLFWIFNLPMSSKPSRCQAAEQPHRSNLFTLLASSHFLTPANINHIPDRSLDLTSNHILVATMISVISYKNILSI